MNKILKIFALFSITFLLISCGEKNSSTSFNAMDTFMTIQAYGKKSPQAIENAKKLILQIEQNISTTNSTSDIFRLNHGETPAVSNDTLTLTSYSLKFAEKTQGAFNPALYPITSAWGFTTGNYNVPSESHITELLKLTDYSKIKIESDTIKMEPGMALDFGAIGKGYAGDQAIQFLRESGITSALLDLGGNIQTLGNKPDGKEWNIGIKSPWTGKAALAIRISNKAVITSGGYERFFTADDGQDYIHIFNGKNGMPVNNGIAGVTIVTESGLYADALSTSMFVMGLNDSAEYWKQHPDFEMIIFTDEQDLYFTEGLQEKLTPLTEFNSVSVIHK